MKRGSNKKPFKYNRVIMLLAVFSFLIAVVEGYFFYAKYAQFPMFRILLTLQNSIKAFLFTPEIPTKDLLETLRGEDVTMLNLVAGHLYGLAVFIAPLCTATVVLFSVELTLRRWIGYRRYRKAERVLIFGYNQNVKLLLENEAGSKRHYRIHLVTTAEISNDEELTLSKQGVVIHNEDILSIPAEKFGAFLKRIELAATTKILLLEGSPTHNFSIYLTVKECEGMLPAGAHFHFLCEVEAVRHMVENYYDQTIIEQVHSGAGSGTAAGTLPELSLFSLAELKADDTFETVPLHTKNSKDTMDVHLVIAGFGKLGQQMLLQAFNRGVLTSSNMILVDVFDNRMAYKAEQFTNRFYEGYAEVKKDELTIRMPQADGFLQVRFHEQDIFSRSFSQTLLALDREQPITYAAVCVDDADVSMHCMMQLERVIQVRENHFPIAINLQSNRKAATALEKDTSAYTDIFAMCSDKEILTVERICREERWQHARQYHEAYQKVSYLYNHKETTDWDALQVFMRRENVLLDQHQAVKAFAYKQMGWLPVDRYLMEASDINAALDACEPLREMARTEHRRWCYTMAANGWHAPNHEERKGPDAPPKDDRKRYSINMACWETLSQAYPVGNPAVRKYDLIPYLMMDQKPGAEEAE